MARIETEKFGPVYIHEVDGMFVFGKLAEEFDLDQQDGLLHDEQVAIEGVKHFITSVDSNYHAAFAA